MGVYLNPISKLFENTINSEIYVDKSGLLNFTNSRINTTGNKTLIDYCNEIYYVTKKSYAGNILLVGINYNRTTRKHT